MRILRVLLALPAILLAALAAGQSYVPGEVLVKFRTGSGSARLLSKVQGKVAVRLPRLGIDRIQLPATASIPATLKRLRAMPEVVYAEPNYVVRITDVDDPLYPNQWALRKILAPTAWNFSHGSADVLVAMLDTGVDLTHPDLAGKIGVTQNFVGLGSVTDGHGHGTHTAGTVAALTDNALGVASLGYDTRIIVGKVANDDGNGNVATVAQGIEWAADNGAKVISMSLGVTAYSSTLKDAVDDAWSRGLVLVAAAGNDGKSTPFYPAAFDNCIAVAATDESDRRCSFSNFGSWVRVSAPGNHILSLFKQGKTAYMSGTSMATPHVAALAALLWAHGARSNAAIRYAIVSSGDPTSGFGAFPAPRINARKALLRLP